MAILQDVGDPGGPGELIELLTVRPHQRVIPLEDDPGLAAAGGEVLDEGREAVGTSSQLGGMATRRVLHRHLDLRGPRRRHDGA